MIWEAVARACYTYLAVTFVLVVALLIIAYTLDLFRWIDRKLVERDRRRIPPILPPDTGLRLDDASLCETLRRWEREQDLT